MEEKYTFEDWESGKVNLNCEALCFAKDQKPVIISWDHISEKDQFKIQKIKEENFKLKLNERLEIFKNTFLNKYEHSKFKENLLELEIKQSKQILFSKFDIRKKRINTTHWDISFETSDLILIQEYAKRVLLNGQKIDFEFIHSINSQFLDQNKVPYQIYSQACYDYFNFLKEFKLSLVLNDGDKSKVNSDKEPDNINNTVFTSGYASEMFKELVGLLVGEFDTASFSFIYHKLIDPKVGAINMNINQIVFCHFLQSNNFGVVGPVLKKRKNKTKQIIFDKVLLKYNTKLNLLSTGQK